VYLNPGNAFLILIFFKLGIMFIFNITGVYEYFRTNFRIIKSLLCWTVIYMTILLRLFVIPIKKDVLYLILPPIFNVGLINILQTFCVQVITHRTTNSTTE